jgi:hypothetical protein
MKKKILCLMLGVSLMGTWANAQIRRCGSMENLERLKAEDPSLETRMQLIENATQQYVNNPSREMNAVINIPVVVHVVYNTTAQNISDAQIRSQIDVLNEDFRRLNADRTNTPSAFGTTAADAEITFCLAGKDPNGATTTGIIRKSTTVTSFSDNDGVKYSSSGGDNAWPSSSYLNLWVCNLGGGLLGYAQFPGGPAATDGVVILYSSFGRGYSTTAPYDKGRTATHEVGHWLNLRHIWGDAACGSDLVTDTPTQQTSNYGCPAYPHRTCSNTSSGDEFMNYMDYTDDGCMNMFSLGQKSRMQALFVSGGSRYGITTSTACGSGTTTTCNVPSGLSATSITSSSVTLNWGSSGATSYNVRIKSTASTTWTTSTATTTSTTFTGLAASTTYEFQVQSVCSSGTSAYSASSTFTTPAATTTCNVPSGLSATSITSSSVTLNWGATGATSYNVRIKSTASTTWTTSTSTTTSKGFTGLAASTSYEFQVQSVCSSGTSAYSASSTFTTPAATATSSTTLTIGTGTNTMVAPYGTYYMDEKSQFIITKAELIAAGYSSSNSSIKALAFNVYNASGQAMNGFSIKMRHTTASSFSSTSYLSNTSMTTVYSATKTVTTGWNTHTFTTPFAYNGVDNLLIEICWDNSSYTTDSKVYCSTLSSYNTIMKQQDVSAGGLCAATTGTQSASRPNIRLTMGTSAVAREASGIETIDAAKTFNLYPNPASTSVTLQYATEQEHSAISVSVYNIMGASIDHIEQGDVASGDHEYTIDLSSYNNMPNGIYLLTLNINGQLMTKRFVLTR